MGSSTASETTINTSTDSSNTIVTTVTATDGDTEDSLDLNEPLDYLNTDNLIDCKTQILQPIVLTQTPPQTANQHHERTTPATVKQIEPTKFNFEIESPKKEKPAIKEEKKEPPPPRIEENCIPASLKDVDTLMNEQIEALRIDARRRNSYKAAQNDFDKIEVMPDEDYISQSRRSSSYRSGENETVSPKPKHRHKKSSNRKHHSPSNYKGDKFTYDEKHIAKYREKARMTPPLPDLRVDFFNETMDSCQQQIGSGSGVTGESSLFVPPVSIEKRGSVCLNKCLREVGAQLEANATSPINVTTNPLENSVHFGSRKAPQATIVVQQPSLSLDHSNVSTILLKNGSEFLSNVENSAGSGVGVGNNKLTSLKKQKEENMKQLLDVANNLTLEEIHDFEMRYVFVSVKKKLYRDFSGQLSLQKKNKMLLLCEKKTQ